MGSLDAPNVRFMIDSAVVGHWERWLPTGLFYGVTCNPLLLQKAQVPCQLSVLQDLAHYAFRLGAQEIQLQAWGGTVERYVETGVALAAVDSRVVVKVPVTEVGTTAAARLMQQGIRVTLTGVYAVPQVLIAAAIAAEYAAPYLGRIHDLGRDGCGEIGAMQRSLSGMGSSTRLLVASIRRVEDIVALSTQGLKTFTVSSAIAQQFFDVAATQDATLAFEQAAEQGS